MSILVILAGCSRANPIHPRYEDLAKNGFYAYVLPIAETQQRGWEEIISIWGYDFHCQYDNAPNNLHVDYKDKSGQTKLEVIIGHWNEVWDWSKKTTEVPLNTKWSAKGNAVFYNRPGGSVALMFEDRFGLRIQVWSDFAVTETINLINKLDYVGPPSNTMSDPWKNCK